MKNFYLKKAGTAKSFRFVSVLIISGLILTVFTGCDRIKEVYSKKDKTEAEREVPVFAVNTIPAAKGQIQDYISLTGDIVAGSTVDVYSEAAGKVYQLHTSVGSRVNRGAAVATIDPSRPGMTFKHSVATAPISGTVVALPAQVGMTITQAVPLARIAGGGALEIKLNIAERFISKMALNLPCEISLDAWPGEVFRGSINEVSPTVDPASRTMELRVNVNNPGSKLKQGMFAKVRIITEQKNNIVKIPVAAVISRFGEQYVFAVEQDAENPDITIVRKKNIVPGIIIDGIMEIQSGLAPDEEIVIRGQTLLDDGSRVNIIEKLAPLSSN
ncbi:MAG: efflux RND transporter periplasmic adaptor subunit [Treponema sp.]|jgi:multidrug efflux pump subunit AcrA (membrane-fusion protein)|nr:efflux RND transporter periplasmic adaptor subunit [Treponema sp.]